MPKHTISHRANKTKSASGVAGHTSRVRRDRANAAFIEKERVRGHSADKTFRERHASRERSQKRRIAK